MSLPPKQISELKTFIQVLRNSPQTLHQPELAFFKEYLESLNATIPAPTPKPQAKEAPKAEKPQPKEEPKKEEPKKEEPKKEEPKKEEPKKEEPKETPKEEVKEEKEEPDTELWSADTPTAPMGDASKPVSEENQDEANTLMGQARKAFREKDFEGALKKYTEAIALNPTSAVLFASRGEVFLALKRPNSAIRDANRCLEINPDSQKGFKVRGTARRYLGLYEEAILDLYQGNKLDWDEVTDALAKSIKDRVAKIVERKRKEEVAAKERELEERKRRAAEARKRQQEEADQREKMAGMGGMPGMGGMGGMGGMPGMPGGMGGFPPGFMEALNDPDVKEALSDSALMAQIQACIQDPAQVEILARTNPKIKKVLEKLGPLAGLFGGAGTGGFGGGGEFGGDDDDEGDQGEPGIDDLD